MKTRFLRSRRRQFRAPQYPLARFTPRNEREEDYPEIEVIGPGENLKGSNPRHEGRMTAGAAFQPRIPTAPSRNLRLLVIDAAGSGGFRHAVELACKLRQRGLDIDVAGFVRELRQTARVADISAVSMPAPFSSRKPQRAKPEPHAQSISWICRDFSGGDGVKPHRAESAYQGNGWRLCPFQPIVLFRTRALDSLPRQGVDPPHRQQRPSGADG